MTSTSSSDTTWLYLVRHGATDANIRRPYILQGCGIDGPLNTDGRQQAEAAGRFLSEFDLQQVYASPMQRAVQTAEAIAAHHGLPVEPVEGISECNVGRWEGMDWDTIMGQFPDDYAAFMDNPGDVAYLDGESYGDVLRRVEPAITDLLAKHTGQSIAIVAHNVVNRVYLASLMQLDLRKAKGIRQANGCVNVIRYEGGEASLVTMNAEFHLPHAFPMSGRLRSARAGRPTAAAG